MEIKFDGGKIEYRLPNFLEGIGLCGDIGMHNPKFSGEDSTAYYYYLQNLLKGPIEKFITKIDGYKNYEDLLKKDVARGALIEAGAKIINSILGVGDEKKQ